MKGISRSFIVEVLLMPLKFDSIHFFSYRKRNNKFIVLF